MLHSEVIGQKPNLTSCSFRAFRFAKRCPGSRGSLSLFDGSSADSRPFLAAAGAGASLRAGWLGWLIGLSLLSVGADDLGVPFPSSFVRRPEPPSIVKKDGFPRRPVGPPRNDQDCHCEERSDAAIRIPVP